MEAVVNLGTEALDRIGRRIDAAWKRINASEKEWVNGSLELAQALAEGKERAGSDKAFGIWLKENEHDHVNKDDRAALIRLAGDPELARDILTKTTRRSYQHIWDEVKDRFRHVTKPGKPRGRRKGEGRKPRPKQTDNKEREIVNLANAGKTSPEIATEVGAKGRAVRHLLEDERIRQEAFETLLGAAAAKNFTEKGALRIEDAIRIHKTRLNKAFEQQVNEEVRRRIAAADDATRKHNKELDLENLRLSQMLNQRGIFTESQYAKLMMCVHPDNSASESVRREMQALLNDKSIRRRLIKS